MKSREIKISGTDDVLVVKKSRTISGKYREEINRLVDEIYDLKQLMEADDIYSEDQLDDLDRAISDLEDLL